MQILNFIPGLKSKYLQSYKRNTVYKNNEKHRKFEHKMASPEKLQICRNNFEFECIYHVNHMVHHGRCTI